MQAHTLLDMPGNGTVIQKCTMQASFARHAR